MNAEILDRILEELGDAHRRKTERLLLKAKLEMETINREDVAYYDGAYDAIKAVKRRMEEAQE